MKQGSLLSLITDLEASVGQFVSPVGHAPLPHVVPGVGVHLSVQEASACVGRVARLHQAVFPRCEVKAVLKCDVGNLDRERGEGVKCNEVANQTLTVQVNGDVISETCRGVKKRGQQTFSL